MTDVCGIQFDISKYKQINKTIVDTMFMVGGRVRLCGLRDGGEFGTSV